jgi:hypothetical protein
MMTAQRQRCHAGVCYWQEDCFHSVLESNANHNRLASSTHFVMHIQFMVCFFGLRHMLWWHCNTNWHHDLLGLEYAQHEHSHSTDVEHMPNHHMTEYVVQVACM